MTPKLETTNPTLTSATFEDLVKEMLVRLDEDPEREGLQRSACLSSRFTSFLRTERPYRPRRDTAFARWAA